MSVRKTTSKRPQAKRSNRDKYVISLLSNFCRDRALRRCERCGAAEADLKARGWRLEAAHIEVVAKRSVRYHPDNVISLCRAPGPGGCHYWMDFQASTKERLDFAYEKRGAALDAVFDLVKQRWDRDLDRALKEIKAARALLKAA